MITKLNHIGIAVTNLDRTGELLKRLFGVREDRREDVPAQQVRVSFFEFGNLALELTEAISADSVIHKYIENRGEGIHHLSFEVDDHAAELRRLEHDGIQLVDRVPRRGADHHLVAFLHPKSTNGILIELCQKLPAAGKGSGDRVEG
jgi:methylmalonyl-CoA/ethylmalonyl-CoA epimerase